MANNNTDDLPKLLHRQQNEKHSTKTAGWKEGEFVVGECTAQFIGIAS